jgi:DNA (cytosine-5)-methyltransferase 1
MPDDRIVKPDIRDAECMQGFEVDWTKPAEKVARPGYRWKLVGNAVTVDVAEWIGHRLVKPKTYQGTDDFPLAPGAKWPRAAWSLRSGRFGANVSAYPKRVVGKPLAEFLQFEPEELSVRATAGFLSRTTRSSLRFPEGFIRALERHLERMTAAAAA